MIPAAPAGHHPHLSYLACGNQEAPSGGTWPAAPRSQRIRGTAQARLPLLRDPGRAHGLEWQLADPESVKLLSPLLMNCQL
jgi:hypothetical protein